MWLKVDKFIQIFTVLPGCATFVVAIGPPQDIDEGEINAIASDPLATFKLWLQNRNFDDLVNFIPPIVMQTCLESRKYNLNSLHGMRVCINMCLNMYCI